MLVCFAKAIDNLIWPFGEKIINARFWIEAIGNVPQRTKKEQVELAIRDEDGVKRKLMIFESLVKLPLEMEDTILCVGLIASIYGSNMFLWTLTLWAQMALWALALWARMAFWALYEARTWWGRRKRKKSSFVWTTAGGNTQTYYARCMYRIGRCEGGICVHDRFGAQ